MLTRRKFIDTTLVAGAALATSAQQVLPQPAAKRTIVDAQVHLWKANTPDWPWDAGARPQLPEPFTIERVLPMMDEAGVDRVVIVPPGLARQRTAVCFFLPGTPVGLSALDSRPFWQKGLRARR